MPLILAIESDRKQAARIEAIARDRLKAEIIVAESADEALKALVTRTPELLLTPQLMSSKDETALDERLRELDAAGKHVQTLMIPVLAPSSRRSSGKKGGGLLNRLRGKGQAAAEDGCDPSVFAAQIEEYLQRAADDRANAAAAQVDDDDDVESVSSTPIASTSPASAADDSWPAQFDEQLPPLESTETLAPSVSVTMAHADATMPDDAGSAQPAIIQPTDLDQIVELDPIDEVVDAHAPSPAIEHYERAEPASALHPNAQADTATDGIDVLAFLDAMSDAEAKGKPEPSSTPDDPWEGLDLDNLPVGTAAATKTQAEEVPAARQSGKRGARAADPAKPSPAASRTPVVPQPPPVSAAHEDQEMKVDGPDLFMEFVTFDELCVVDLPTASLRDIASSMEAAELPEVTALDLDSIQEMDEPVAAVQTPAPAPPQAHVKPPKKEEAPVAAAGTPQAEGKPGKKRAKDAKPAQDEWGMYDPVQCGFAALLEKLDSDKEESEEKQKVLR